MYTLAYAPLTGVSSKGWALVAIAFFVDIYSYVRSVTERSAYSPTYEQTT